MIYILFFIGIVISGFKFPFNYFNVFGTSKQFDNFRTLKDFGLRTGENLLDAWRRIDSDNSRLSHDLTNLAIEWNREWLPLSTKFLASLFVYSNILWIIGTILL